MSINQNTIKPPHRAYPDVPMPPPAGYNVVRSNQLLYHGYSYVVARLVLNTMPGARLS